MEEGVTSLDSCTRSPRTPWQGESEHRVLLGLGYLLVRTQDAANGTFKWHS